MPLNFGSPTPDDLREEGWMVAVHNDYRLEGKSFTFWLFTKSIDGSLHAEKGEGRTDADALDHVRHNLERRRIQG